MPSSKGMIGLLAAALILATSLAANAQTTREARVYETEYLSAGHAAELLSVYLGNDVDVEGAIDHDAGAAIRVVGPSGLLDRGAEVLQRHDHKPAVVSLVVHMIYGGQTQHAGAQAVSDGMREALTAWDTPASLFRLRNVVFTMPMAANAPAHGRRVPGQGARSDAEASMALPSARMLNGEPHDVFASFSVDDVSIAGSDAPVVRGRLRGTFQWPYELTRVDNTNASKTIRAMEYRDIGLVTAFQLEPGELAPVGKIVVAPGEDLYFVMEARVRE